MPDITMSLNDTLELDTIIEEWTADNYVNYDSSKFDVSGIQTSTAIFDPSEPGTHSISVNGQDIKIKVIDPNIIPETSGGQVSKASINGNDYRIHAFKNVGTETFKIDKSTEVDVLIVGGGGGSGYDQSGGGGAGGLIYKNDFSISSQEHTIKVGDGGSRKTGGKGAGSSGDNSSAFGLEAIGGGGGGSEGDNPGLDGGSGGGGSTNPETSGGNGLQPSSEDGGKGSDGADCINGNGQNRYAGGGGGASESGSTGGDGGDGLYYGDIFSERFGENGFFAGGGAGGGYNSGTSSGTAGKGGGGGQYQNGTQNTGGGAGGVGDNTDGQDGGSGIVLIRLGPV
jgi:hypothetical protein